MNVSEVIIPLTFVISSDDMYRARQIVLRIMICPVTFVADITSVRANLRFN